jgi:hypothetical protein
VGHGVDYPWYGSSLHSGVTFSLNKTTLLRVTFSLNIDTIKGYIPNNIVQNGCQAPVRNIHRL